MVLSIDASSLPTCNKEPPIAPSRRLPCARVIALFTPCPMTSRARETISAASPFIGLQECLLRQLLMSLRLYRIVMIIGYMNTIVKQKTRGYGEVVSCKLQSFSIQQNLLKSGGFCVGGGSNFDTKDDSFSRRVHLHFLGCIFSLGCILLYNTN